MKFPYSLNMKLPLSVTSSGASSFKFKESRYHFGTIHSDYYWEEKFIKLLADEFDKCIEMPNAFPIWQYHPHNESAQFTKNIGMNSLSWRDIRSKMDFWTFFTDDLSSDKIAENMRMFFHHTEKFWMNKNGMTRSLWMSPETIYPNSTNLEDEKIVRKFYNDSKHYHDLRILKGILDPDDVFHSNGTIPPL
ncbi:hypothetical protein N9Y92_04135 [Chlamydiales bacterium]|nr:hypothetical protein [Chlamydiales bacterium]